MTDPNRARRLVVAPDDAPDDVKKAIDSLNIFQQIILSEADGKYDEYLAPLYMSSHGLVKKRWRFDEKINGMISKLSKGEFEKQGRAMALINGAIRINQMAMLRMSECPVCLRPVDGAHKCHQCKKPVHGIICSDPVGEEGHGQTVLCHLCCPGKTEQSLVDEQLEDRAKTNAMDPPKEATGEPSKGAQDEQLEDRAKTNAIDPPKENTIGEPTNGTQIEPLNERKKTNEEDPLKAKALEMMNEVSQFFSDNKDNMKPMESLCNSTVGLAKRMANGITNAHWLLNPDTTRNIQSLLTMNMDGKRASAMTSIISNVNTTLQKNIDQMEKASFCPVCKKPAPRTNVCDFCSHPTHLICGARREGRPEFYCSLCIDQPDIDDLQPHGEPAEDDQGGQPPATTPKPSVGIPTFQSQQDPVTN